MVRPFALLCGPRSRRRALRGVVEPAVSSFGLRAVVRLTILSSGFSRCHRAHRVVIGLFASWLTPPCRAWSFASWLTSPCGGWAVRAVVDPAVSWLVLRVVVDPAVWCFRCLHRRWAHYAVLGPVGLSFPSPCRLLALRVVEPAVSLLGPWPPHWAPVVVVRPFVLLLGPPCRCCALCWVVGLTVSWPASSRRCLACPVVLQLLVPLWLFSHCWLFFS